MATSVGLVTIAVSSYLITYNSQIFKVLEPVIKFLTPYAKDHDPKEGKQKELFENYLNKWRGDNEQLDDITILGIKI